MSGTDQGGASGIDALTALLSDPRPNTAKSSGWARAARTSGDQVALLSLADGNVAFPGAPDPTQSGGWDQSRTVSAALLEGWLAAAASGRPIVLSITGARISGDLIPRAPAAVHLILSRCRFEQPVDFGHGIDFSQVEIDGCHFAKGLSFSGCVITRNMRLENLTCPKALRLDRIVLAGDLTVTHPAFRNRNDDHPLGRVQVHDSSLGGVASFQSAAIGDLAIAETRLGALQMSFGRFAGIGIFESTVAGPVSIVDAGISDRISVFSTSISGPLALRRLAHREVMPDVQLLDCDIGGRITVDIPNALRSSLRFQGLRARGDVMITAYDGPEADDDDDIETPESRLSFADANIGGDLVVDAPPNRIDLLASAATVGGHVRLRAGHLAHADLSGATLKGELRLSALSNTAADLYPLSEIEGRRLTVSGPVTLSLAGHRIIARLGDSLYGSSLVLRSGSYQSVALDGATIERRLHWAGIEADGDLRWTERSSLDLRGATLGSIGETHLPAETSTDRANLIPAQVALTGLTVGSFAAAPHNRASLRAFVIDLIRRDRSGEPQPATALAKALKDAGYGRAANPLLYEAKERARRNAIGFQRIGLGLQKILIGYGIGAGYWLILPWIAAVTGLGVWVINAEQAATGSLVAPGSNSLIWQIGASLDLLLPIIEFDATFGSAIPGGFEQPWTQVYFWAHKTIGWVFAAVLGLALAGRIQKA